MAAILMYHRIAERAAFDPWSLVVSPVHFLDHLEALRAEFEVMSLQELCACHHSGHIPVRAVCLTFDDGYFDNLAVATPLLEQVRVPATVFLATGFLGHPSFWWDRLTALFGRIAATGANPDRVAPSLGLPAPVTLQTVWRFMRDLSAPQRDAVLSRVSEALQLDDVEDDIGRPMTAAEARRLAGSLVSIGAHTVSHPWLPALDQAEIRREISESMRCCEDIAGVPVRAVAYPYGAYDEGVVDGAAAAGVACALTTRAGAITTDASLLALPRLKATDCPAADLRRQLSTLCGMA